MRDFNLQIFGSSRSSHEQVRKRDPMTPEHEEMNLAMHRAIMPILSRYTGHGDVGIPDSPLMKYFDEADSLASQANKNSAQSLNTANELISRGTSSGLENAMRNMNVSIYDMLNEGMGAGLNNWANRGIVNSSVANRGLQTMQSEASKAAASNWGNLYNTMLGGAQQGAQLYAGLPQQYYQNAVAPIMPAYNKWRDLNQMYYGKEDYDTIVKQGK